MVAKDCDGDWEWRTDKAPVPVKLTVRKVGSDWMVACMVPKGNMMHCMLKEDDAGNLKQGMFNMTKKEPPLEIMLVECELKEFFSVDITGITREGDNLTLQTDEKEMVWSLDTDPKK